MEYIKYLIKDFRSYDIEEKQSQNCFFYKFYNKKTHKRQHTFEFSKRQTQKQLLKHFINAYILY